MEVLCITTTASCEGVVFIVFPCTCNVKYLPIFHGSYLYLHSPLASENTMLLVKYLAIFLSDSCNKSYNYMYVCMSVCLRENHTKIHMPKCVGRIITKPKHAQAQSQFWVVKTDL